MPSANAAELVPFRRMVLLLLLLLVCLSAPRPCAGEPRDAASGAPGSGDPEPGEKLGLAMMVFLAAAFDRGAVCGC